MTVLALDLASVAGWCCGEPGGTPVHGSVRFASPGCSHEAIFAAAAAWMTEKCICFAPTTVVWEAPLPTSFSRGHSNVNTTSLLFGLPAVVGTVAYQRGIYDIRKAATSEVRQHFIGANPKRAKAKAMVIQQCRLRGWDVDDDNEADACATWDFMCALIDPKLALRPTPVFRTPGFWAKARLP